MGIMIAEHVCTCPRWHWGQSIACKCCRPYPAGVALVQASYLADDGSVARSPQFPVSASKGSSGSDAELQALPNECALASLLTGRSQSSPGLLGVWEMGTDLFALRVFSA